jgi:hypothetical protein
MAIELENNLIKTNNILHEENVQSVIESDIIVPDTKPDVVSVLHNDGAVKIYSKEIHKDMMVVRGVVCFKVLYMSDDPSRFICSMEQNVNFDQTIDINGDCSRAKSSVVCKIEHIDCTILNGRKISLKAILNCQAKIVEDGEMSTISNINGIDNVQVLTQTFNSHNNVQLDEIETSAIYETEIPIGKPAVKSVLRADGNIMDKEIKITGGKAVVKANLELKCLYVPDMEENPIASISGKFPFSEILNIPESVNVNDVDISVNIIGITSEVKEDDDGDSRVIQYEVTWGFNVFATNKQSFDVIRDAYSVTSNLNFEKNPVKISNIAGESKMQSTIKEVFGTGEEIPIKDVYNISSKPVVTEVSIEDDKVNVEGIIEINVIYLLQNEEQPLGSYQYNMPFHNDMDIKGVAQGMRPEARVEIDGCNYNVISEKEVELKLVITVTARVLNEEMHNIITRVEELPADRNEIMQPSMIVYYVQAGDTLWEISKRYLTTVNELIRVNGIDNPELITVGQQLMIPKIG